MLQSVLSALHTFEFHILIYKCLLLKYIFSINIIHFLLNNLFGLRARKQT
jgi:hypothetical protein